MARSRPRQPPSVQGGRGPHNQGLEEGEGASQEDLHPAGSLPGRHSRSSKGPGAAHLQRRQWGGLRQGGRGEPLGPCPGQWEPSRVLRLKDDGYLITKNLVFLGRGHLRGQEWAPGGQY